MFEFKLPDLGEGPRDFHSRRAAPHDDKGEKGAPFLDLRLPFGRFEGGDLAAGEVDLSLGRGKDAVGDLDLRRMDREHARKTITPGIRCITCQTFLVTEIRIHRIYGSDFRSRCTKKAQRTSQLVRR